MDASTQQRKRVLFFIPNLAGGGAERVLINLLKHLDRGQFDPQLVVMRLEGPHAGSVPDDVPVTVLHSRNLWTVAPRLAATLRDMKPDVVVATTGGAGVPAVLAHRLVRSRARLIVWERSVLVGSERTLKKAFLLRLKKVLWPRADLVTAVGTFVEQDIQRHTGIGPDQTMVLYSPILDAEIERLSEEPVEHPWFQESTPIVLCVARFEPVKDHRTLLQGFAKLRETHEARLVLLGDGTIREDLEEQVQALDLADTVWFAGFVDNPFRYMKRSSMLVLTSLREGVPGVVVQAMACGLPVIGTDSPGGTGELVQNEHTGLLIPMSDPEALAHAMRRLVDDPAFAGRLVEEARSSIDRFEVDPALEGYERSLLSNDA